jgi:hypothetical protein
MDMRIFRDENWNFAPASWPRRDAEGYLRFMSFMFKVAAGVVIGAFVAFCLWLMIIIFLI